MMTRATADRQMVEDSALGSGGARIIVNAGVDTLHVDARMIPGTISVAVAADNSATIQSISVIALATTAVCFVVVREAFGVHAAIVGN